MLSDDDTARIVTSIPEPVSDAGEDVAVWVTNLCKAIEDAVRKQDAGLIRQLTEAAALPSMKTGAMLRQRDMAIEAARARLEGKP